MKKISYLLISLVLLINITACAGYKPIFGSSNLSNVTFEIADYSIKGNKRLGNQIYSKLYSLSNLNKNNPEAQSIYISIEVLKDKTATIKNNAGKILEYKISLNSNIIVKNYLTEDQILSQNFSSSSSYKVQDQYSETIKLEKTTTENLVNKTYQDLLIKISENMSTE